MKKIAVVLSGCGVYDGAEINEAVLTLLHIAKNNAQYQCFAPDREQLHTINHLTGEELQEKRNILQEAARIARGEIKALHTLAAADFDGLILPGGFGAAKNLCDFAIKGAEANIHDDIKNVLSDFSQAGKPIGYMCIAPALIPFIHDAQTKFTIGNDVDTARSIEAIGAKHATCPVDKIIIDKQAKVVTTPAYMLAQSLPEAELGIEQLVKAVIELS